MKFSMATYSNHSSLDTILLFIIVYTKTCQPREMPQQILPYELITTMISAVHHSTIDLLLLLY